MQRAELKHFLREVLEYKGPVNDIEGWVMVSCPLAPWTHQTGEDGHPSCGLKIVEDGFSRFHCFTCKEKGHLDKLVRTLADIEEWDADPAIDQLRQLEWGNVKLGDWDDKQDDEDEHPVISDDHLTLYESAEGHPYLKERGITDETAYTLGLRVDPDDRGVERILFPVCNREGDLLGFTGRATDPSAQPKVRDYHGLQKRKCLLGIDFLHCAEYADQIVLVEGLFDFAWVFQLGFPAMAVMHSGLTKAQAELLIDAGRTVTLLYDNDEAGEKGMEKAAKLLYNKVPVYVANYMPNDPSDPAEMDADQIEGALEASVLPSGINK